MEGPRTTPLAAVIAALVVTACGELVGLHDPDGVPLSDDGGAPIANEAANDDIAITPQGSLDLGAVTCGAAPSETKSIVIENKGETTAKYSVEIPEGSAFELGGPLTGDLAPGASVTIAVTPKPVVAGEISAQVVVTAGRTISEIDVRANADGGHLAIAPTTANLGDVRKENGGTLDVAFTNTGTRPITIARIDASSPDYSTTWEGAPAALAVDPGATKTVTVALAGGAESDTLKAVLTPVIEGAHCGDVPALPVEGKRVNQDVTISKADFGKQYCTTSPTLQRDVVISNYTAMTLAYNATLKNGATSAFSIVSGASDTIAPGTTTAPTTKAIKLGMKPVGTTLGAIDELVNVEITGIGPPSGGLRQTNVLADVRGVVFKLNTNNSTGFRYHDTRYFTLSNTGNEDYSIHTVFIRDSGTTNLAAWRSGFGSVSAGSSRQSYVQFDPDYTGNYAGTWTFTNANGIPMCNGSQKLHVQGSVYN